MGCNCLRTNQKVAPDPESEKNRILEEKELLNGQLARFENPRFFTEEYLRHGLLGQGAHSKVYKCESKRYSTKWAVKIVEKRVLKKHDENRYINEIMIMKSLDHPNIIRIREFFQDKERIYMVMELCKGGELFH